MPFKSSSSRALQDNDFAIPITSPAEDTVPQVEAFEEGLPNAAEIIDPRNGQVVTAYDPARHTRSENEA